MPRATCLVASVPAPASSMQGPIQHCFISGLELISRYGLNTHEISRLQMHMTAEPIGATRWAIAEGYIPKQSTGPQPEMLSHETACMLNASDQDAHVRITIFFADRNPVGPYRVTVPAKRTVHLRFNDLKDPQPIPPGTDYASLFESDVPIVVQHTRLDSRQSENALLSTIAYSARG